ncbi:glycoside hydrolase superfamily [Cladorrhinum samala]|uniref:xylan 1,4-beta-xylosidase n=1 Tax=Cladorrhinum samala TaxID=585594 RepID=A0AAV9HS81_9PEZI|nr:glycoside hydrolase superfamily [Cladorrhinum samala]
MRRSLAFSIASGLAPFACAIELPFQFYPDCANGLLAGNQVCNATLSPPERAAALVAALTINEKLGNLVSKSKGAPRIGLPAYNWWSEALHGVAYAPGTQFRKGPGTFNSSTSFPMPLLMAAAFNDELIEEIGKAIGIEGRAFGNAGFSGLDYWTPNVNPFRDPRWGRGSETPGEDILRVKRYAASMIRGLEGPEPEKERLVVATCKHYAANDFEDWNGSTRHDFNAKISLQDLAEYYLMPFQQCARDSKVGSIMCAYNAVNGVPSCANPYLLQTVLRDHWNWTEHNNYITSDCEAVLDVSANHHYAPTNAAGTAMCFAAGMDTSCEYESSSDIPGAWTQGLLNETTVDRALLRLYEGIIRAGYFDGNSSKYSSIGWSDVNQPEFQQLALQSAVEGTVLLKNDGTLPLDVAARSKVAMIGFWADAPDKLSGGYSGTPSFLHSPAFAARQMGLTVKTAPGPVLQNSSANDNWTATALDSARDADYILYFGGLDTSAAGETKDRWSIDWPSAQLELIKALGQLGKPLVVIQLGDQLDNTPLLELGQANSILWANWPGQDGGTAVMQLLAGIRSPAGRLPVTQYPANFTSLVPLTDMNLRPTGQYPGRTYRWYPSPIQPFGFGLHYTTFQPNITSFPSAISITSLLESCQNSHPDTCPLPSLPVQVANTGNRTSDYVVLAFISGEFGPKPYPIKTLASYTRLHDVAPGSTSTANLSWTLGNLARHDEQGNTVLYPGTYTVTIDEPTKLVKTLVLEGDEPVVLDKWPQP